MPFNSKNLFDNAVDSIELGVEDFKTADDRRLSAAVRNLYAGLLLLFKCILAEKSQPGSDGLLIYKNFKLFQQPDGAIKFMPKGKSTVDFDEIKERITSLNMIFDWKALIKVRDVRNDMEHLYHLGSPGAVKQAFADALPLIVEIIDKNLGKSASSVFSSACWSFLKENQKLVANLHEMCLQSFSAVSWDSELLSEATARLLCDKCGSSFIKHIDPSNEDPEMIRLQCHECHHELDVLDAFENAINDAFSEERYRAATDGGEPVIDMEVCPNCDRMSYSLSAGGCVLPRCEVISVPTCRSCGEPLDKALVERQGGMTGDMECEKCLEELINS